MAVMKATLHCGRLKGKSKAKHNDRSFDTSKNESIIHPEYSQYNVYYVSDEAGKFQPVQAGKGEFERRERDFYKEHFTASQKAKNARYRAEGHKENCRSVTQLRKSAKTSPQEIILQVGNEKNPYLNAGKFQQMTQKFAMQIRSEYKDFKILNMAIHYDELSAHAHIRGVFVAKDKDGLETPNQTQALQAMGFGIPDPSKPKGQKNNELVSFTEQIRTEWQDIIERTDPTIEIDREVKNPNQKHQSHKDKKAKELAELEQKLDVVKRNLIQTDWGKFEAMEQFIEDKGLSQEFEQFYENIFDLHYE